jgi:hypothetical protein
LGWFIDQVNRLLFELTDVANFTVGRDPENPVDPVFGFEHHLTVDRLLKKTMTSMALDEAPVGNLMAFEVADLYDTCLVGLVQISVTLGPSRFVAGTHWSYRRSVRM